MFSLALACARTKYILDPLFSPPPRYISTADIDKRSILGQDRKMEADCGRNPKLFQTERRKEKWVKREEIS
jgi:hypothetical protein